MNQNQNQPSQVNQPSIAILITAFKEPSVEYLLDTILNPDFNNWQSNWQLWVSAPDESTRQLSIDTANKWQVPISILADKGIGKPSALNLALETIDCDWLICTDGDVFLKPNSIRFLVQKITNNLDFTNNYGAKYGAVSGRPVSNDSKDNFFGYIGYLLADAAHYKRFLNSEVGKSYFVSGYLVAYNKPKLQPLDPKTLVDDAQFSMQLINQGLSIGYEPKAQVMIKYPINYTDWIAQKRRSAGGYNELKNIKHQNRKIEIRSFWSEVKFVFFPIKYASNPRELVFSLMLYPLRLWLWLVIFWDTKTNKTNLWVRVESTK